MSDKVTQLLTDGGTHPCVGTTPFVNPAKVWYWMSWSLSIMFPSIVEVDSPFVFLKPSASLRLSASMFVGPGWPGLPGSHDSLIVGSR